MCRRRNKFCLLLSFQLSLLVCCIVTYVPHCGGSVYEAKFVKASPATVKVLHFPYRPAFDRGSSPSFKHPVLTENFASEHSQEGFLQIEPSDAINEPKYSQPSTQDIPVVSSQPAIKVPKYSQPVIDGSLFPEPVPSETPFRKDIPPPLQNHPTIQNGVLASKDHQNSSHSADSKNKKESIPASKEHPKTVLSHSHVQNSSPNVTQSDHFLPSSSENILNYERPDTYFDLEGSKHLNPSKKSPERAISDDPSHFSDNSKFIYSEANSSSVVPDLVTNPPFILHSHAYDEVVNQTETLVANVTRVPSTYDIENISSSSISFPSDRKLSPGTVAGIVIGVLVCTTVLSSSVIYILYQKYNGRCTRVVEGKFNSDNCGYLDDSLRSSIYLNNHIELPKESSEEMSSLDNDSFLNSLETMTIQNYWTDSSKNTKV